jgi:ATP-dependent RNA helicase DeaD
MLEFTDLGLSDAVAQAFATLGFETPTEIQKASIPVIAGKRDAYISSATGTGKTFAYLAPILSLLDMSGSMVQAIIITPTHDLAAQIERETHRLSEAAGINVRVVSALGSIPLKRQLDRLGEKPHIVVGSVGRIRDLVLGGHLNISSCLWAVLDEADRLFENEAIDTSAELLSALPATCSRVLVSATLPNRTLERSSAWFRDPVKLVIDPSEALRTSIEHWCFHSSSRSKLDMLRRFEAAVKPERCLLFASSNAAVFNIQRRLDFLGFPAVVLKSDKDGTERFTALSEFTSGAARWLITTDLGARGLDLPDVSHVISFDLPEEPTVYMHRAGRTGRAGKHGVSIAIADLVELRRASKIAVRYNFPFVCKILDSGVVHDIEPENFFALAEEEESARKDVKLEGTKRNEPRRRNDMMSRQRPAPRIADRNPVDRAPGDHPSAGRISSSRSPSGRPETRNYRDPSRDRSPYSTRQSKPAIRPRPSTQGTQETTQRTPMPNTEGPDKPPESIQAASRRKRRRHKSGPKEGPAPSEG